MADELDLDVENTGSKKKLIIIIVAVLILLGISVVATLFLTGALGGDEKQAGAEGDAGKQHATDALPSKALYLKISPEFIVNFENPTVASYLQMDIQVMSREQAVLDAVQTHLPVIRNDIILLLSSQRYEDISTTQGKEKLRADVLKVVQDVMQKEIGKPGVEAVYFTSMIMQ